MQYSCSWSDDKKYDTQSFVGHGNMTTLGWTCHTRAVPSCDMQTCQGPEMKMCETVRHSGEGAIFRGGGREHCLWCGLCLNFLTLFLHSCCRTEEIKFSIKPITRKPIQNLWLFYKIKYKTLSMRCTYVYNISVANTAYTKWAQCHRP